MRMRTIKEAAAELREMDEKTAITEYRLRQLVLSGAVPSFQAGNKYLLNMDLLIEYISNGTPKRKETIINGIRKIPVRGRKYDI